MKIEIVVPEPKSKDGLIEDAPDLIFSDESAWHALVWQKIIAVHHPEIARLPDLSDLPEA